MLEVLRLNFQTIEWMGLWHKEDEKRSFIKSIQFYVVLGSLAYFGLCTIIKLLISLNNVDEMANSTYLAVDWISFCFAVTNFVVKRDKMIKLRRKYREAAFFQLENADEMNIHQRYVALSTKIFKIMGTIYLATILDQSISPLFSPKVTLPYNIYTFYDIENSPVKFWITYLLQALTMAVAGFISFAHDSMIFGFIILAGGQFESLACRIRADMKNSEKSHFIKTWSIRYKLARELVKCVTDVFLPIIVTTIVLALLILCTIIYVLSEVSRNLDFHTILKFANFCLFSQTGILSMAFLELLCYLISIMCQTFMFCWFGTQLKDKVNS